MADITCQGCGTKYSSNSTQVYKCSKCNRVLCDKCRGTVYTPCSSAKKGTPKCSGTYRRP